MFADKETLRSYDRAPIRSLFEVLGEPERHMTFAEPQGYWRPGIDRPQTIAEDPDPSVVAAIGRCAVARLGTRGVLPTGAAHGYAIGFAHETECGWCAVPLDGPDGLLAALDYATFKSRLVLTDLYVWRAGPAGTPAWDDVYVRSGTSGVYMNPVWQKWAELPQKERAYRVSLVVKGSRGLPDD